MRTISLILKACLLYGTTFITILFVAGIDSIYDKGYKIFFGCIILVISLILLCKALINEKDINDITLYKYVSKILGED